MSEYFYGCGRGMGHYFHRPRLISHIRPSAPWTAEEIDGQLQPGGIDGQQPEGVALLHQRDGWTMISFWDRSVDHRRNSNGNFIFKGEHDFDAMLALAAVHFPEVVKRLGKPLQEYSDETKTS